MQQTPERNLDPFVANCPAIRASDWPLSAPFLNEGFIGGIGFFLVVF